MKKSFFLACLVSVAMIGEATACGKRKVRCCQSVPCGTVTEIIHHNAEVIPAVQFQKTPDSSGVIQVGQTCPGGNCANQRTERSFLFGLIRGR